MTEGTTRPASDRDRFQAGLQMRKQVLGEAHVQRSMDNATKFTRPMQELVTEYCWGTVWTRDGLELRDRSLINLAMLTVLNRHHEFSLHVKGAVANGVSTSEIREVLLQSAIYAGVPAALESFRIAEETLTKLETDGVAVKP